MDVLCHQRQVEATWSSEFPAGNPESRPSFAIVHPTLIQSPSTHSTPFVFWVWEMNFLVPCLCIGCTMEGDIWLLPELLGIPDPSNLLLDLKEVIIISLGSGGTDGHAERIVSKGSRERNIVKVNNDIAETGESRKGSSLAEPEFD